MSRTALVALLLLASLAPAAAAKGPHASLSAPGEAPQPGEPWTAKLWVAEFENRKAPPPLVSARRGGDHITFDVTQLSMLVSRHQDVLRQARYRLRGVFPSAGEWLITVTPADPVAEQFRFEPLQVGGARAVPVRNVFAFAGEDAARGTPLPPEVVAAPPSTAGTEDEPARLWIPAGVLALAAGAAALLRRRLAHRASS